MIKLMIRNEIIKMKFKEKISFDLLLSAKFQLNIFLKKFSQHHQFTQLHIEEA